jgi:hypothetical protein
MLALLLPLGGVLVGCHSDPAPPVTTTATAPGASGKAGSQGGSAAPSSLMAAPPGEQNGNHAGGQAGK